MSTEANNNEGRDQNPKPWSPTPEQFEKLTCWADALGKIPQLLYDENREEWLLELAREPKDLARIAPFMKQRFLEFFELRYELNSKWTSAEPSPLIALLQDYVKADPMKKALINFVLLRLTGATMQKLVGCAVFKDSEGRFWQERALECNVSWGLTDLSNMSNTTKALLKRLYPDPEDVWEWDELQRDWELSLRDRQQDVHCGIIAIAPIKDGEELQFENPPEPWHDEWALRFAVHLADIWGQIPTYLFLVGGTLPEVKRQLDVLLGADTPEIQTFPSSEAL